MLGDIHVYRVNMQRIQSLSIHLNVWQYWRQAFNGSSIFFLSIEIGFVYSHVSTIDPKFAAVLVRRTNYHGILSEKLLVGRINDALSISFKQIILRI